MIRKTRLAVITIVASRISKVATQATEPTLATTRSSPTTAPLASLEWGLRSAAVRRPVSRTRLPSSAAAVNATAAHRQ